MKDLVSKVTFSFVMAQLFPGAIALFAVSFAYRSWEGHQEGHQPGAILPAAAEVLRVLGESTLPQALFLVAVSIGAGMLIHGLHWAVLGALENGPKESVFDSRFHGLRIILQIILAPVRAVWEVAYLSVGPRHIRNTRMDENVSHVHPDLVPQYEWIQEFYLYSAQFFAHVSYALMAVLLAVVHFITLHGWTGRRAALMGMVYLLSGIMFTLGRIQLASMFRAEYNLVEMSPALFAKDQKPSQPIPASPLPLPPPPSPVPPPTLPKAGP